MPATLKLLKKNSSKRMKTYSCFIFSQRSERYPSLEFLYAIDENLNMRLSSVEIGRMAIVNTDRETAVSSAAGLNTSLLSLIFCC